MAVWNQIFHQVLTSNASDWHKSNDSISQDYDHLCLKVSSRTTQSTYYTGLNMRVNNVTSGNKYTCTAFYKSSTGANLDGTREGPRNNIPNIFMPGTNATTNTFGSTEIWIPNYTNDDHYKTFIISSVSPHMGTSASDWIVGGSTAALYLEEDAITGMTLWPGAGLFATGTSFSLYGIKSL